MSDLKFSRVNNEEYNTVSIKIENAIIDIDNEDFQIINRYKDKHGYRKADIVIKNKDIINKLKKWQERVNEYLKCEVGTGPITIVYGNMIHPKVSELLGQDEKKQQFKIKSIWINENNKPFVQLYYVNHMT